MGLTLREVRDEDLPLLFEQWADPVAVHMAGTIGSWGESGEREVTYWIGRSYWGKGIATDALTAFLAVDRSRPRRVRQRCVAPRPREVRLPRRRDGTKRR
jgi:RimJ/RimL family protein N-acetyltransferase